MQSFELEEMALFLIRDADEAEMWIDRWTVSYPIVHTAEADGRQTIPNGNTPFRRPSTISSAEILPSWLMVLVCPHFWHGCTKPTS